MDKRPKFGPNNGSAASIEMSDDALEIKGRAPRQENWMRDTAKNARSGLQALTPDGDSDYYML
jgi:hypothetical protein